MHVDDLAYFGADPSLRAPVSVAQLQVPEWHRVERAFRGIFSRGYFTNNGPLVKELDEELAKVLGVGHAVSVTNGTVALMMMIRALGVQGEVIVPAYTFSATGQAIAWAGLKPVLCDVDRDSQMLTPELVRPLITSRTSAILGVHLWGHPCAPEGLQDLADAHRLQLLFDACHGMGCMHNGRSLAHYGAAAALSLHATKVVNGAEGGFIITGNPSTAAILRDMRNFYSAESGAPDLRMNGKMSEAQAAFALLSLSDLPVTIAANRARHIAYREGLSQTPSIAVIDHPGESNFQYVVVDVDETATGISRDLLIKILEAENVICRRHFYPGLHRVEPFKSQTGGRGFPNSDYLSGRSMQLPSGDPVSLEIVEKICKLIANIVRQAPAITARAKASRA